MAQKPLTPGENSQILQVRFSRSDAARIDSIASMLGLTRSEFVRLIYQDLKIEFEENDEEETDEDDEDVDDEDVDDDGEEETK